MPRKKKPRNAVRDEVNAVIDQRLLYPGEDNDVELGADDLLEVLTFIGWCDHFVQAATAVRAKLRIDVAHAIGEGGAVRYAESLYRYNKPIENALLDSFDDWAKKDLNVDEVLAILSRRGFRVTALRGVAEQHGFSEDMLEGTFYVNTKTEAEPTVTAMPLSNPRAPKYAAKMDDGDVYYRGRPKQESVTAER